MGAAPDTTPRRPAAMNELGFYALAGGAADPSAVLREVRRAEQIGLGSAFVSERFDVKEAATLSGAIGAATERIGVATAATNPNTRHPMVTAAFATTMHRLTGGRFTLGLGRGIEPLVRAIGLQPVTGAELVDTARLLRRLWHGEMVLGHDGPAGAYPYLAQDPDFDEDIPILMVAIGEKTLELAGSCMDAVVLHTFFGDEALTNSVVAVRRGAERAGRDPDRVRVWSVLATIGDHIAPDLRLKKTVGRMASYLQGYGDLLVKVNGWDPAVLARFRADPLVSGFRGAIDTKATTDQLERIGRLIPDEWLAEAATGTAEQCAHKVVQQLALGADSVILHGADPDELAPVVDAYAKLRPDGIDCDPNPGRTA